MKQELSQEEIEKILLEVATQELEKNLKLQKGKTTQELVKEQAELKKKETAQSVKKQRYFTYKCEVGGKDMTAHTVFPPKWSSYLDERLDEMRISMRACFEDNFAPLTPVKFTLTDLKGKELELNWLISSDDSVELIGQKRYNHELMLIEETKLLEGIVVDALTFTNDLGRNYTKNAKSITYKKKEVGGGIDYPPDHNIYVSPIKLGEFIVKSIASAFSDNFLDISEKPPSDPDDAPSKSHFIITLYRDNIKIWEEDHRLETGVYDDSAYRNFFLELISGTYELVYRIYGKTYFTDRYTEWIYTFYSVENHDPLPQYTITSVINRVLDVAETHLVGKAPRFHLNPEQAETFDKILAPEFAFTRATLKEILDQIGGFIHGIPRLNGNEIRFDMLGGTTQATLDNPIYPYNSNIGSQNIENYCTSLDSNVDNLACIMDAEQGTVMDPYFDGYKTMRTETVYARIEEGNMFIQTLFPIQELKSVKCGFIPGKDFEGGDITPYVFELAEYSRMSSFKDTYPDSKAYAVYYTQGQKGIYGLNFKYADNTGGVFQNYAIINILEKVTGQSIGGLGDDYPALAFQVSYTPIFGARVQQTKQYISDMQPRALAFNQGANLVETRFYGENMKGVVARMGNVERVLTHKISGFSLLPKIGQTWGDDYFVSGVTCECNPCYIDVMTSLSKNFNRLSQYIGINSQKRFYEVSEKQAYQRDMKYVDYCVIGDAVAADETLLKDGGIEAYKQIFTQSDDSASDISHAVAQAKNENGDAVGYQVCLPAISTAFGDAMMFTFAYEDNYSAGAQSAFNVNGQLKGYFTNAVTYADYYGRFHGLSFSLHTNSPKPDSFAGQSTIGNKLPQWDSASDAPSIATDHPVVVQKDGSEIIAMNYGIENVTNRRNMILGSALARNCSLVRGAYPGHSAKLYVLPKRLNKFTDIVDLSGATMLADYGTSPEKIAINGMQLKITDEASTVNGLSWAIVDGNSRELLMGANLFIAEGDTINLPYMTFRHDIFNQ